MTAHGSMTDRGTIRARSLVATLLAVSWRASPPSPARPRACRTRGTRFPGARQAPLEEPRLDVLPVRSGARAATGARRTACAGWWRTCRRTGFPRGAERYARRASSRSAARRSREVFVSRERARRTFSASSRVDPIRTRRRARSPSFDTPHSPAQAWTSLECSVCDPRAGVAAKTPVCARVCDSGLPRVRGGALRRGRARPRRAVPRERHDLREAVGLDGGGGAGGRARNADVRRRRVRRGVRVLV